MCELLAVRSERPYPVEKLLDWARLMEEYGVAGFGWGLSWIEEGRVRRYRSEKSLRTDPVGPLALQGLASTSYVVHLRRSSFLTEIRVENSQPYLQAEEGAFCHNGYFERQQEFRPRYRGLEGTSDSEVGFRMWLEERARKDVPSSLRQVAQTLGGNANMLVLDREGRIFAYAGHEKNPLYRFEIKTERWIVSSLHSPDGYVMRLFPLAENISEIDNQEVVEL